MPCGVGSPYFNLVFHYIEMFYDKTDVVEDMLPYLKLINENADVLHIKNDFN